MVYYPSGTFWVHPNLLQAGHAQKTSKGRIPGGTLLRNLNAHSWLLMLECSRSTLSFAWIMKIITPNSQVQPPHREAHSSCLYRGLCSFSHDPHPVAMAEGCIMDEAVNKKLCWLPSPVRLLCYFCLTSRVTGTFQKKIKLIKHLLYICYQYIL